MVITPTQVNIMIAIFTLSSVFNFGIFVATVYFHGKQIKGVRKKVFDDEHGLHTKISFKEVVETFRGKETCNAMMDIEEKSEGN